MTWEEAVIYFRSQPKNSQIVSDAYLEKDLTKNIRNFQRSEEWLETLRELSNFLHDKKQIKILDIGAGNGIASINFALHGFNVTALEPDKSNIVGSGAIKYLAEHYKLNNINIKEAFGENLPFEDSSFDLIYARQVMHHANNLNTFVKECSRVLMNGGVFMATRDHVVKNEKEKNRFLLRHPLQKLYGGENAFRIEEYKDAIRNADLKILKTYSPSQSAINYYPWTKLRVSNILNQKFGSLLNNKLLIYLLWRINLLRLELIPGRLYSFIALKQ